MWNEIDSESKIFNNGRNFGLSRKIKEITSVLDTGRNTIKWIHILPQNSFVTYFQGMRLEQTEASSIWIA